MDYVAVTEIPEAIYRLAPSHVGKPPANFDNPRVSLDPLTTGLTLNVTLRMGNGGSGDTAVTYNFPSSKTPFLDRVKRNNLNVLRDIARKLEAAAEAEAIDWDGYESLEE
ncbi:MAG: hypothetical protein JSS83_14380 [Cyanobacteria bacterium SZAS LIN-3]|nr:hypothetical protein [Cyanobacteria bacterium SZAS LIN-3]